MKNLLGIVAFAITSISCFAQSNEPIEINLPSKTINGTKLKMKAKLFTMLYNQESKSLTLNWKVSYYADSAGHYGQKLNLPGVSTYSVESVARNTVRVIPATGEIIEPDSLVGYPPDLELMGQYDFFYNLAENNEINVHNLIRAYGSAVKEW